MQARDDSAIRSRMVENSSRSPMTLRTKQFLPILAACTLGAWSLSACGGGSVNADRSSSGDGDSDGSPTVGEEPGSSDDPGDGDGDDVGTPSVDIVPLYDESTPLEPEILFDRGDAIVTMFADRARDRHAREDEFQSYDHYLSHYWIHRTARFKFTDKVDKGGSTIDISFVTEWELDVLPEFRAWYYGMGTVAHYHGNYAPMVNKEGPGLYDNDHVRIGDGVQYKYTYTIESAITLNGEFVPLEVGQFMEIEVSQFLEAPPEGRDNYYGTTYLYEVGKGGLVPWYTVGSFDDKESEREDSRKLPEKAWLGGRTTLPYQYSDEPDNHFMQMATNLSSVNGQAFVLGRRVHHTNMIDGSHDESEDNGIFDELVGLTGSGYINTACDSCHQRNGRAPVAPTGEPLDRWVFKVGDDEGLMHPLLGNVLQPGSTTGASEGSVSILEWVESPDGLRSPRYAFSGTTPERYSARLAPQLVGLGLLEAVSESTILTFADPNDADADGISGRPQIAFDPESGEPRLGRFGYKAAAGSLRHQIAAALNTDMGVMTSVLPEPDCGAEQTDCGAGGGQLSDEHLEQLVKYVALLGVRARRSIDDEEALRGEQLFEQIGCSDCHKPEMSTSAHHPYAELRQQTIHPYTDLLLHDMGEGLADNLGEGVATGSEWRTTPLWGLGLSACVTGGVEGPFQDQVCTPHHSYLHDGRARTIEEAILWHGGEGSASRDGYANLSQADKLALLAFLESL